MFTQNIAVTKNTLTALQLKRFSSQKSSTVELDQLIVEVCEQVAPIWPLANFIAVNPLQGFESLPFRKAIELARKLYHGKGVPDLEFFHRQFKKGRITSQDLVACVEKQEGSVSTEGLTQLLIEEAKSEKQGALDQQPLQEVFLLFSEWADQLMGTKLYPAMQAEVTKWCAAYFDRGEAAWGMPSRHQGFYGAWKELVQFDESYERAGVSGFREYVKNLPGNSLEAIRKMIDDLGIPEEAIRDYLTRHFAAAPGWSGLMAHHGRELAFHLKEEKLQPLLDLLAMRLAYDVVGAQRVFAEEWLKRNPWEGMLQLAQQKLPAAEVTGSEKNSASILWLEAYERNYRNSLLKKIESANRVEDLSERLGERRPRAQAVFCIDVRSEALRRNLEEQGNFDTLGFAGFFAVPLAHQGFGESAAASQCPVLIRPKYLIQEAPIPAYKNQSDRFIHQLKAGESLKDAVHEVKNTSMAPFAMVETFGGLGLVSMFFKSWLPTTLNNLLKAAQKAWQGEFKTKPVLEVQENTKDGVYQLGIPIADQIAIAENSLRIMGLLKNFGRLVLLCGHGSTTTNNAYASALDCGACGGHRGAPNAKVAARIFNDQRVRNALELKGISIPTDTVFIAGEHNTATDTVSILEEENIPRSHWDDLAELKLALQEAKRGLNWERTQRFDAPAANKGEAEREVARRSTDWSEARPEWGLAGNAAFIVAPRSVTKQLNLESRSFLHSYDWKTDPHGSALEVIMTAPMVVAEWINTQYYFSTVDNEIFGSGTKVIHNVVGQLGVMQGNVSDLKIGLPLQSVSNGKEWVHEPMRLLVVIQAPKERIAGIIQKHESVKKLVVNEWIRLIALDPSDQKFYRYSPSGEWEVESN